MNASVPEVEEKLPTEVPESAQAQEVPAEAKPSVEQQVPAAEEPSVEQQVPAAEEPSKAEVPAEPPMAWHRFLTGFGLWLEALYHAAQAGWMLLGKQYYTAELREMAYAGLPKLRLLDWALAGLAAVAALLCVLSAVQLRKRRRSGPRLLCWAYILLLAGQLGLAAGRWFIIGLTPLSVSTLGPMAVYLALLLVNGSYYRRRRAGFMPRNQMGGHVS